MDARLMRAEFTKRTKLSAFQRSGGRCERCTARLYPGFIEYHHDTECTFGGTADAANCIALCRNCHRAITGKRAAAIAKSNRQRDKHIGIKRRQGFRGWRKFNGEVVWR